MTEAEWLVCELPGKMVWSLKNKATERKKCLLGAACLRRIVHLMPGPVSKKALLLLERYADGDATTEELAATRTPAMEEARAFPNPSGNRLPQTFAGIAAYYSDDIESLMHNCAEATAWAKAGTPEAVSGPEVIAQCKIVREIFGNPFRAAAMKPGWRTTTVTSLAQAMYTARNYDRMPILADALEDAGCSHRGILDHCREPGDHVRGCWVVDLVLGKS